MITVTFTDIIENITATDHLYQWDVGQILNIKGLNVGTPKVHFAVKSDDKALVVQSELVDGDINAVIPDKILQSGKNITAYVYLEDGVGKATIKTVNIPVIARAKPNDYIEGSGGHIDAYSELIDIRVGANGVTYNSAGDAVRRQVRELKSDLKSETNERVNADNALSARIKNKVAQPLDGNNQPTNGTRGQSLRTKGDGTTEWADVGLPTDEQTAEAISAWLDSHPEATTTVQDESLTIKKLVKGTLGFVTYSMFGAKLNGVDDDSDAIIACHNFANEHNIPVKQNNGTIFLKTGKEIEVKTNVDLSGCEFLLNDEHNDKDYETHFYVIKSDIDEDIYPNSIEISQLAKGKTYIPFLDDYPNSFIHITSDKILGKRAYIENGETKYATWYMSEVLTTGQGGYLIDGSLLYDYTDANEVVMHRYSSIDNPVTFDCPQLVVNRNDSTSMPSLIKVERSNVTLRGLTIKNLSLGSSANTDFIGRVLYINSFNCIVENATGVNPTEKFTGTLPMRSGYCIQYENASTGVVRNCRLTDNWGVINTQCVKNMTFRDSTLNRIDNHWTMNNFDIDNITMVTSSEGIILGHGDGVVNINNVIFIHDKNYYGVSEQVLIKTRADLGGTYEGDVNISNVTAEVSGFDNSLLTVFRHYSNIGTQNEFYKTVDKCGNVSINNLRVKATDSGTLSAINCLQKYSDGNPTKITIGNIRINNFDIDAVNCYLISKGNTAVPVEGSHIFTDMIDFKYLIPQTIQDDGDYEISDTSGVLAVSRISNRQIVRFAHSYFDGKLKHDSTYNVETLNTNGGAVSISNNKLSWTGMKGGALVFNALDFTPYRYLKVKGTLTQASVSGGSHSLYSAIKATASWNGQTVVTGDSFEGKSGDFEITIPLISVNETGYFCLNSWQQEITIDSIKCYA